MFGKKKETYTHREIDKSGARTPSPLRCSSCGNYTVIPGRECPKCNPKPQPKASR